jgi:SprT-like family
MSDSNTQTSKPTRETYDPLQLAYETFNRALFDNTLPNCLITLQRRRRTYGYFCADRFGRSNGELTDEIALNPSHFRDRPVEEVLATLAHEMVHLWQHHFGKPGRGRYHNLEWAEKMKAIGLQPTATGKEGGAEIGDVMKNCAWEDGAVRATYRQPFDLLTETTAIAARSEADGATSTAKKENWLPLMDSNHVRSPAVRRRGKWSDLRDLNPRHLA